MILEQQSGGVVLEALTHALTATLLIIFLGSMSRDDGVRA
jgi:hypothetical protein